MKLILFGPPGVGKGTLSGMITKKYPLAHISTGDIIRDGLKNDQDFEQYRTIVESGQLLPDIAVIKMIEKRLSQEDCKEGFILDGFPRTIAQADALDKMLTEKNMEIDHVINLNAKDETVIERISGRRVCTKCNAIYHAKNSPPKVEGVCDKCGGEVVQRKDDNAEVVKTRLETYKSDTAPVIDYYKEKGKLRDIDTEKPLDDIFADVLAAIE